MRIRYTKGARQDADALFAYIAVDRPIAAGQLLDRIEAAIAILADFPEIGRPVQGGRRELTTEPPYVVIYRVIGSVVVVLRILHGARLR